MIVTAIGQPSYMKHAIGRARRSRNGTIGIVRLATFNILNGRSTDDDRVDVDRFAAAIRTLDADVLALQEVDRDQPRSQGLDLTSVAAETMGATDHRFVAAMSGTAGTAGMAWQAATGDEQPGTPLYGIALLSRYPMRNWQVVRLPPFPVPVPLWHRGGRPHLARDEARVAIIATVETPRGDAWVAATHLSYLSGSNVLQLRRLARALAVKPAPAILMGDLNMRPPMAQRFTRMEALSTALTFPAHQPEYQIDHILSRGISGANSGESIRLPLSDHLALTVEVPDR